MSRDFANRGASRKQAKARRTSSRAPRAASRSRTGNRDTVTFSAPSFAVGALFGGALVLLLPLLPDYLDATPDAAQAADPAPARNVVFKFDDLLSQDVVPVDKAAYPVEFEDPSENAEAIYLLQAASFKSFAEAADLQARLEKQQLPASVSRVSVKDVPWYRVTVGPFAHKRDADRAMTRLRENRLAPLPLKRG